jgi:hypothetical protein
MAAQRKDQDAAQYNHSERHRCPYKLEADLFGQREVEGKKSDVDLTIYSVLQVSCQHDTLKLCRTQLY